MEFNALVINMACAFGPAGFMYLKLRVNLLRYSLDNK